MNFLFQDLEKMKPGFGELLARVKALPSPDSAHAFSHIERVAKLAVQIYSHEKHENPGKYGEYTEEDREDAAIAALLHDCVPVAKDSPLRKESSRLASEQAAVWLKEVQWGSSTRIARICDAVLDHSFSSGRVPSSLLGECLQDADRLEALGAIGLYRTIATGVAMKAELFDVADPWAKNRELDDRKYSVDHFFTKLLKLPATFRTEAAKVEAKKRADFLMQFIDQLKLEIGT